MKKFKKSKLTVARLSAPSSNQLPSDPVLSLALSKRWSIHQLDAMNAFPHGNPSDFGTRRIQIMCAYEIIYGLKQAPKAWNKKLTDFVSTLRFLRSRSDHSLFVLRLGSDMAYLLLYVDDIIWTASSDSLRRSIISLLSDAFAMKDLGSLHYFLGIDVSSHDGSLFLSQ